MAENNTKKLQEAQSQFETKNSAALEALYFEDPDVVDLEVAENLKIISNETRKRIEQAMGNHMLLFQAALAKESRETDNDDARKAAFMRAFSFVYGKFLLEDSAGDLVKKGSPFMETLSRVLKFRVDEHGLKGRSELQATAKRLKMLDSARVLKTNIDSTLSSLNSDKKIAENNVVSINGRQAAIDEGRGKLTTLDFTTDLDAALAEVQEVEVFNTELNQREIFLNQDKVDNLLGERNTRSAAVGKYMGQVIEVFDLLSESTRTLLNYYADANSESEVKRILAEFIEVAGDIPKARGGNFVLSEYANFSPERWQTFVKKRLKKFLAKVKFSGNPALKAKFEKIATILGDMESNRNAVKDFQQSLDEIWDSDREVSDVHYTRGENRERFVTLIGRFQAIAPEVQSFKSPRFEVLVPGLSTECDNYLTALDALANRDPLTVSVAEVRAFVDNSYRPFIAYLNTSFSTVSESNQAELTEVLDNIAGFDRRIAKLESYDPADFDLKNILSKAFPGIDPMRMKELERQMKDLDGGAKTLKEIYDHFGGAETKTIYEKFQSLDPTKAANKDLTAGKVRELERVVTKAEEDKGKLQGLKTSFSDAKSTELNTAFLEFDAAMSSFDTSVKYDVLNENIAALESKIKSLELEIEAKLKAKKPPPEGRDVEVQNFEKSEASRQLARLKKQRDSRDDFVKKAKSLGSSLQNYCLSYLEAAKLGIVVTGLNEADVKSLKSVLDGINVDKAPGDKAAGLDKLKDVYEKLRGGFDGVAALVEKNLEDAEKLVAKKFEFEAKKKQLEKAKSLHGDLKTVMEKLAKANDMGVVLVNSPSKISDMLEAFDKLDPDDKDFDATTVYEFYDKYLKGYFDTSDHKTTFLKSFETRIVDNEKKSKQINDDLKQAKSTEGLSKNLSDAKAARRIVETIIGEQIRAGQLPDLSPKQQQKLAQMLLASDVALLQSKEGYEQLAKRGSAELLDTVRQAGFRQKLIGFRYKQGDKVNHPFKGLKPEVFADWAKIEHLFDVGRFNYENGFFVLAAMELFEDEAGVNSLQTYKLKNKLKELLAEKLGVKERMDEAGIDDTLNDAFQEQMEKSKPVIAEYFNHYDLNHGEWDAFKAQELELRYQKLVEEHRLDSKKVNDEVLAKRKADILDEADDYGIRDKLSFAQNSVIANLWENHKFAHWLKDRGYDIKQWAKGKAKTIGISAGALAVRSMAEMGRIGGRGLWEGTKMAARVGIKYPLMLAAKPLVGFINLFRKAKWQPISGLRDAVRNDVSDAVAKTKGTFSENGKGFEKTWAGSKTRVGEVKYATNEYKSRTEVDLTAIDEAAKELAVKAEMTPIEIADAPVIDFQKYKDKIAKMDKGAEESKSSNGDVTSPTAAAA